MMPDQIYLDFPPQETSDLLTEWHENRQTIARLNDSLATVKAELKTANEHAEQIAAQLATLVEEAQEGRETAEWEGDPAPPLSTTITIPANAGPVMREAAARLRDVHGMKAPVS